MKPTWWLIGGLKKWWIHSTHLRCNNCFRRKTLHVAISLNPSLRPHSNRNRLHRGRNPGSLWKEEQVTKKQGEWQNGVFERVWAAHSTRTAGIPPIDGCGSWMWISWWSIRPNGMMPPWGHAVMVAARVDRNLGRWDGPVPLNGSPAGQAAWQPRWRCWRAQAGRERGTLPVQGAFHR